MSLEADLEFLRRQNRRLKRAMISTIAIFLVVVAMVTGFAGLTATRARLQEQRARTMAEQARAEAQAAFERTHRAAQDVESQSRGKP